MYYLTFMTPFHCKRGKRGCEKCLKLSDEGQKFCLLKIITDQEEYPVARPIIEILQNGEPVWYEYDFVECLGSKAEIEAKYSNLNIVVDPSIVG